MSNVGRRERTEQTTPGRSTRSTPLSLSLSLTGGECEGGGEARRGGSDLGRLIEQGIRRPSIPSRFRVRRGGSGPIGL